MCKVLRRANYVPSFEARPLYAIFRGAPVIFQILRRAHYMPSSGARPLNVNSEVYQPRATFRDMFIIVIPALSLIHI